MTKRISALNERLGDSTDIEVADSFADDLPLQIRCHHCGNHLLPQLLHGMMFYKHPTMWSPECVAPRDFRITAAYVLHEALTRVVASRTPPDVTIGDLLLKAVLFVTVEPTKASRLHVHLHEPEARAA